MPRDLTDLMERATSFAPPEPHDAADVTAAAAQRQRRRTASIAGGIALAVVVAGVAGYGVTRGHDTTPEPTGPYQYGQRRNLSEATPTASAQGFRELHYDVPSVASNVGRGLAPIAQWLDVDAQGRLAVQRIHPQGAGTTHVSLSATYQVVDGPGGRVRDVPAPPSDNPGSSVPKWQLSFTRDDLLRWRAPSDGDVDERVTDLDGAHVESVTRTTADVPGGRGYRDVWLDGGRVYFSAVTREDFADIKNPRDWLSLFSYDPSDPATLRRETPRDALSIDVAGGQAVWRVGTSVRAEDLASGDVRTVPIPVDAGCHLPAARQLFGGAFPGSLSTNGELVSVVETCPESWHLVVTDLAGRLVADLSSSSGSDPVGQVHFSGDLITFVSQSAVYVDDLARGELLKLGPLSRGKPELQFPQATGRFVLWYDDHGGHVGEFSH